MIYHLFQYLERAGVDIPGMGLMHYLSFRAMMATVAAVLFTLLVGKRIIRILQRHQIGDVSATRSATFPATWASTGPSSRRGSPPWAASSSSWASSPASCSSAT